MARLILFFLNCIAHLPLKQLQRLGAFIGMLIYYTSPKVTQRIRSNLTACDIALTYQGLEENVKRCNKEICKGALEMSIALARSPEYNASLIVDCHGWEHVEAALAHKQGIIFLTPHLGNFDIAGRYLSQHLPFPLTAMYRPPKLAWLDPVFSQGRTRGKGSSAPANKEGVRIMLKALKNREAIIILPDQVPKADGVWAPFFGVPAYTMTLAARLALMPNVQLLYFFGERMPKGKGFVVHIEPAEELFDGDKLGDACKLNRAIEKLIKRCPEQYLWSYNRFKCPADVKPPANHTK